MTPSTSCSIARRFSFRRRLRHDTSGTAITVSHLHRIPRMMAGCMNLRISTNGGTTWTVVPTTALTPAYDRTSLYSFGFQHHEGPNVPGWCGASNTWHQELVNLSAWAGQSVKLRFAFASDPSYSTPDNPAMFGWQVDNVRVYQNRCHRYRLYGQL